MRYYIFTIKALPKELLNFMVGAGYGVPSVVTKERLQHILIEDLLNKNPNISN